MPAALVLTALTAVLTAAAPPARGVPFDGRTAFVAPLAADALAPQALTVTAWVKVKGTRTAQVFLNTGRADSGFTFYLFRGKVRMLVRPGAAGYRYALAPPPEPDTWTHYAGRYDGRTIEVFRNGRLCAAAPAPGRVTGGSNRVFIGALNERERFLTGRLADVCVWRRVLTNKQIAALAAGHTGPHLAADRLARWTAAALTADMWPGGELRAKRIEQKGPLMNEKDDGFRGIWYANQASNDEYVYKYSGGLGTYCAKHIPHAWYVAKANKTFFCYGGRAKDRNTLLHMVSCYDHATGRVARPTVLLDKQTTDAHDNPVLNVDDAGRVWIFSSSHGTSRPSYISRSVKPHDVDRFELVWTGNYSYPQPWHVPGHGFLFLHTHYTPERSLHQMVSADGVTWTERRLLARIEKGHYQVSRPCGRRVGTAFNFHPEPKGLNWRSNLYYMETADFGQTWTTADGRTLDLPLTDPDNPALVHDYRAEGLNVYMKDITFDAAGRPVILYVTSKGYESGPANVPRTWTTARWTGADWDIQGQVVSDNNYDTGSLYIEPDGVWRLIGPTEVGPQPFNPGGEVAMWTSRDQGRSWRLDKRLTANSPYNHTYVRRPVNAHPDFYAFWADGHGRQPSDSRLYFCTQAGAVFRLPTKVSEPWAKPEPVEAPGSAAP